MISRTTIIAALAGMLGACTVASPLQVRSTNPGAIDPGGVALDLAQSDAGTARGQYAAALRKAFTMRDVSLDPKAPVIAEFAFSISGATDGILAGKPVPSEAGTAPDWVASPREKRRFDKCGAKRMRGTLVLFDRATGGMAYRGEASQIDCGFDDGDIDALADRLVADATGISGG